MAGCGCIGTCSCFIEGINLAQVTGSGDVTDPYVVSVEETLFDMTSASNALIVTPGGTSGHQPGIDLAIDPAGTAPVTVTVDGLKIDCCDPEAAAISAEPCNDLYDNLGLYADAGVTVVAPGASAAVGVQAPGGSSPNSWIRSITNNEGCDLLIRVGGNPFVDVDIISAGVSAELEVGARLEITSAHTFVGGGTQRSVRFNESVPASLADAGEQYTFAAKMDDHAILPSGETLTVVSYLATTKRANLDGTTGSGNGYTFQTPYIIAQRVRRVALDVVGA